MLNILIVEDSHEVGRLVKEALLSLDSAIQASVVPSAEEAMLEAARAPVHLLVVDIRLPGISGLDLVTKMRARQPDLKVIVITGMTDEAMPGLAAGLRVDGFFRKPVEMKPFLRRAARCLGLEFHPPSAVPGALGIPELLSGAREVLGARGVFLLDGAGNALAQDGSLPKGYDEAELFPSLLAAQEPAHPLPWCLSAANRLAVHWDANLALALIPVDDGRWLATALPGGETALMNPTLLPGLLQAALSLTQLVHAPAPDILETEPAPAAPWGGVTLDKLEALSALLTGQGTESTDADAFWDQTTADPSSPGVDAGPGAPAIGQVLPDED